MRDIVVAQYGELEKILEGANISKVLIEHVAAFEVRVDGRRYRLNTFQNLSDAEDYIWRAASVYYGPNAETGIGSLRNRLKMYFRLSDEEKEALGIGFLPVKGFGEQERRLVNNLFVIYYGLFRNTFRKGIQEIYDATAESPDFLKPEESHLHDTVCELWGFSDILNSNYNVQESKAGENSAFYQEFIVLKESAQVFLRGLPGLLSHFYNLEIQTLAIEGAPTYANLKIFLGMYDHFKNQLDRGHWADRTDPLVIREKKYLELIAYNRLLKNAYRLLTEGELSGKEKKDVRQNAQKALDMFNSLLGIQKLHEAGKQNENQAGVVILSPEQLKDVELPFYLVEFFQGSRQLYGPESISQAVKRRFEVSQR